MSESLEQKEARKKKSFKPHKPKYKSGPTKGETGSGLGANQDEALTMASKIETLRGLPAVTINALTGEGLVRLENFTGLTRSKLLAIRHVGLGSIMKIEAALQSAGIAPTCVVEAGKAEPLGLASKLEIVRGLSPRTIKSLADEGIAKLGDFRRLTRSKILNIKHMGQSSLHKIEIALQGAGFAPPWMDGDQNGQLGPGSRLERLPGISRQSINALADEGIITIEELMERTPNAVLCMKNMGRKGINELGVALRDAGFGHAWMDGNQGGALRPSSRIEKLPWITPRAINAFAGEGIFTLGDLTELSRRDLLRIPSLGSKSIEDVEIALKIAGIIPAWMESVPGEPLGSESRIEKLPGLSQRAINALNDEGLVRIEDVMGLTLNDMRKIPSLGVKSIQEIDHALSVSGFPRAETVENVSSETSKGRPVSKSNTLSNERSKEAPRRKLR
jgi:DNA-directed RNA polymerase alpha subunit